MPTDIRIQHMRPCPSCGHLHPSGFGLSLCLCDDCLLWFGDIPYTSLSQESRRRLEELGAKGEERMKDGVPEFSITMMSGFKIEECTVEAVCRAMGWEKQRIPGTSRIRFDHPDGCGVCGESAREYDVILGIPVCSRRCEELAR